MYKILIVDDEIMIRSGLSKIIRWNEIGFELVGAVGSAGEALKMIAQIPVDAILTDINMPDMTGLELIRRVRKELPRVKAVIISGYSEFEYAREAIELKVENYILKPLDHRRSPRLLKRSGKNWMRRATRNVRTSLSSRSTRCAREEARRTRAVRMRSRQS